MAFDFSEAKAERSIQQRWKDFELYASDSWKMTPRVTLDYGLRWSRFENPYDLGDTISSFDPSTFKPALGPTRAMACWCRRDRRPARRPAPGRHARAQRALAKDNFFSAESRRRVGRLRRRQDGRARRAGQFYQRESLQNGLNLGFNPPFNRVPSAAARSTATPSRSTARSRRPTASRSYGLD